MQDETSQGSSRTEQDRAGQNPEEKASYMTGFC